MATGWGAAKRPAKIYGGYTPALGKKNQAFAYSKYLPTIVQASQGQRQPRRRPNQEPRRTELSNSSLHQCSGVRVMRHCEYLFNQAPLNHRTVFHHQYLVGHGADHVDIVGDEKIAEPTLTLQAL